MSSRVETVVASEARRLPGGAAEVAAMAYPAVLQTLSDTLMQVVDSAIVGRLGVTELGAVGFGGIWVWTATVIFFGAATGVQTFVSQRFGAGQRRECGPWLWYGLYAVWPLALVWFIAFGLGFTWLLAQLGGTSELSGFAAAYGHTRLFGAPAVIFDIAVTSFFRGIGDTRTPMLVTVIANLVNAVLAYGLVFGSFGFPTWGVAGAGAATAFAQWLYGAILFGLLMRATYVRRYCTWPPPRPRWSAVGRYLRTGGPIGGQWFLDMGSFAVFSTMIARMGNAQMAASQAMIQLLSLSFMQAFGISIAAGALVGRYVGAGELDAAERSHWSAMKLGLGLAALVAILFVAVPDTLLGIFTDDPSVLELGRPMLALGALFQLVDAVGIITAGSLRGAGDTRWPFAVQATCAWLVRLPVVYVCAFALRGGVLGAWIGELGYVCLLGLLWVWRFRLGEWRRVRI